MEPATWVSFGASVTSTAVYLCAPSLPPAAAGGCGSREGIDLGSPRGPSCQYSWATTTARGDRAGTRKRPHRSAGLGNRSGKRRSREAGSRRAANHNLNLGGPPWPQLAPLEAASILPGCIERRAFSRTPTRSPQSAPRRRFPRSPTAFRSPRYRAAWSRAE